MIELSESTTFAVYNNLHMINLVSKDHCLARPILFYIQSSFSSFSKSKLNKFYSHILFNSLFEKLEGNTFYYNNIKCVLEPNEYWRLVHSNHKNVAIKATITDGEKRVREINLANHGITGNGIREMLKYLKVVNSEVRHEDAIRFLKENNNS